MPFPIYRETHLRHHDCLALTDPVEDPESFYVRDIEWQRMGRLRRAILRYNKTLLGRLTVGPALAAGAPWVDEARRLLSGDTTNGRIWAEHIAGISVVLAWVVLVCDLPAWLYLATFAYPGLSLTLLRSYAEHQPALAPDRRTAIVEGGPLSGLLYLNNNLHAVHHADPALPWFAIPAEYCAKRDAYASQTGGNVYAGYPTILRRFLFRTRDVPVHSESRHLQGLREAIS